MCNKEENTSPHMLMFDMIVESKKLDALKSVIAFVYGKTPDEVNKDIQKAF